MFYANHILNRGIETLSESAVAVSNDLTLVSQTSDSVSAAATSINSVLNLNTVNSTCRTAIRLLPVYRNVQYYRAVVQKMSTGISGYSEQYARVSAEASGRLDQARIAKDDALYAYYALGMSIALLIVLAMGIQHRLLMQLTFVPAALIVATLTVACCCLLGMTMVIGDFCMSPYSNFLLLFPKGGVRTNVQQYLSCTLALPANALQVQYAVDAADVVGIADIADTAGVARQLSWSLPSFSLPAYSQPTDPLETVLPLIPSAVSTSTLPVLSNPYLQAVVQEALALRSCRSSSDQAAVVDAVTGARQAVAAVANTSSALDCHHAKDLFATTVTHGLCGNTMEGIYVLTVCLFVFSGCLFAAMCVACVLWQYFGEPRTDTSVPAWPDEVIEASPTSPPYPYELDEGGRRRGSGERGAGIKDEEKGGHGDGEYGEDGEGVEGVRQLPLPGCKCPLCAACR